MPTQLILCLVVILLFDTSGLSQSKRTTASRKSALAYYQSSEGGNAIGTEYLKINGKIIGFTWFRESTQMRSTYDNPNARKVGAEWRTVYESCSDEGTCPKLISATFTGRVFSEHSQTTRKTFGSTFEQKPFEIFSECICNCNAKSMSFIYDTNLRIYVSLGGCGHDPSVGYNMGNTEKEFVYYSKPIARLVDKKSNQKVNAILKQCLIDVYNLAVYCDANNITSGTFSETGKFQVLVRLRQKLNLRERPTRQAKSFLTLP